MPYLATKKLCTKLSAVFVPQGKEAAGALRKSPSKGWRFHQGETGVPRATTDLCPGLHPAGAVWWEGAAWREGAGQHWEPPRVLQGQPEGWASHKLLGSLEFPSTVQFPHPVRFGVIITS